MSLKILVPFIRISSLFSRLIRLLCLSKEALTTSSVSSIKCSHFTGTFFFTGEVASTGGIYSISMAPVSFGFCLGFSSTIATCLFLLSSSSDILNVTGKQSLTLTVFPFNFPGFQSGIILIIRSASSSNRESTL